MTPDEALAELEALGTEKQRELNRRWGAGDDQFGVKLGDIRAIAKRINTDHELALHLWASGNVDARFLAILVLRPKALSADELDAMVRSERFTRVADWLNAYVVRKHPDREQLRVVWLTDDDAMAARSGWDLTAQRAAKDPDGLDVSGLLDRLERDMGEAPEPAQWTMNSTLVEIGIHFPEHRQRAIEIGERLGVYSDYPDRKGCISPFAPIWITEMVGRAEVEAGIRAG